MKFRLSNHAEKELIRRRIPRSMVESVLNNPQQVVEEDNGRHAYQSQVSFSGRIFLLRIIVADEVDPAVVVTLYRTSKVTKYWRTK